ncbi:MAG: TonB-dependent siderophore receptor [Daejeonella sp.]|uniref:TonB-dependent receptor n=1 Tax=Daejeonella sp. JGW-45 TaxID=3034148 RepID=UPI0023EBE935|nr:TonB-dependent receptor [Daejeonella sp. JGW-45]
MKRYLLTLIILCALSGFSYSQITLSGKVTDSLDRPVPGTTVRLMEKNLSTVTNSQGIFIFSGLAEGTFNLTVSSIGYETRRMPFTLSSSQNTLNITLSERVNQLQSVEIVGRKEQKYKNTSSFSGTKTETPLKYVPQAISYVTKEVIDDQMAFKTSDVVKNISGASIFSFYNNDIALRGFRAGNALINGLRNPTTSFNQSLLPNVERVEVIKGPASALFANSDPGGTVNTVTKKPLDEARKSINFATGSFNTFRVASDFTGPMNDSRTLLYRLNLAYQNAQSYRELQGGQDVVIAPSVSFIPDEKTFVNFDFVYSKTNAKLDRGQPIFGATAGTDLNSTPISFAIGKNNDFSKETNMYVTTSIQRKVGNKVTLNASYMKFLYDEDLLEHRTSNRYAVDAAGVQIPTLMEMQTIRRQSRNYNDNITLYGVADLKTGPLEHKILLGYDYLQNETPVGSSNYNANGYINAARNGTIATYNPANRAAYYIVNNRPVPNVPHFDLVNPDYSISEISQYFNVSSSQPVTKYFVNGFYIQDQIKFGKFQALLGLRQEYYTDIVNYKKANSKEVEQKATIPRVGLVYSPIEQISLYGTYAEGYQPQGAATIGSPEIYGGPFDPLISNMIEGGAKSEFFEKRLAVNLAVYKIEQNNILINANAPGNPQMLRQIGQQQSSGVELDIYGQILSNLSVTANFARGVAKITESTIAGEVGRLLPNAPKTQGGLWAKYTFTSPALKGIGVGLGGNYVGDRNTSSFILVLPSYVVANGALYYTVDKFRISANLNNIFDKTHWLGGYDYNRLFPGAPRNFMVGVGYSF